MISQQTSFVPPHAEVVDEDTAGQCWISRSVGGASQGGHDFRSIFFKVANFAGNGAYELGLVWWEVREGQGTFRVLGLASDCESCSLSPEAGL